MKSGTKPMQPFSYTGRIFDVETGLLDYRARTYDPSLGRFIQKDPISFAGGDVVLYGYVQSNPINYKDSKGLARIGERPLDADWIPDFINGSWLFYHSNIWYDDGSNSGFFPHEIRSDYLHTISDYTFNRNPAHYDDDCMRLAERNIGPSWNTHWNLFSHNCHDYTNAVIVEYNSLMP